MNMKDALNRNLVVGNSYGYTIDKNGICDIVIGKFKNISEKGYAILEVISRKQVIYLGRPEDEPLGKAVAVKPFKLFPI
jgi:hypothetical protein